MGFSLLPFAGWRYDLSQVGALADVVTSPSAHGGFPSASDHPYSFAHLTGGQSEIEPTSELRGLLTHSVDSFHRWRRQGVLQLEHDAAFYVVENSVTDENGVHEVWSVTGLTDLTAEAADIRLPRESDSVAADSIERALQRRTFCQMDHSPVRLLIEEPALPDEKDSLRILLERAVRSLTPVVCVSPGGHTTRVWAVSDRALTKSLQDYFFECTAGLAGGLSLFLAARRQLAEHMELPEQNAPACKLLCSVTSVNEQDLSFQPHFCEVAVSGLAGGDLKSKAEAVPGLQWEDAGSDASAVEDAVDLSGLSDDQPCLVMVTEDGCCFLLSAPARCRTLTQLRTLVCEEVIGTAAHQLVSGSYEGFLQLQRSGKPTPGNVALISRLSVRGGLQSQFEQIIRSGSEQDFLPMQPVPSGLVFWSHRDHETAGD